MTLKERLDYPLFILNSEGADENTPYFAPNSRHKSGQRRILTRSLETFLNIKKPNDTNWCVSSIIADDKNGGININHHHAYFYHKSNDKKEVEELFQEGIFNKDNIPSTKNKSFLLGKRSGKHNSVVEFKCCVCGKMTKGPLGAKSHEDACLRKYHQQKLNTSIEKVFKKSLPPAEVMKTFDNKLSAALKTEDPKSLICKTFGVVASNLEETFRAKINVEYKKSILDSFANAFETIENTNKLKATQAQMKFKHLEKEKKDLEAKYKDVCKILSNIHSYAGENLVS